MQVSMAAQRGECGVWIFAGYLVSSIYMQYPVSSDLRTRVTSDRTSAPISCISKCMCWYKTKIDFNQPKHIAF